ncbi:MAG: hypothetical protein P1V35_02675 [Planctomycetota bacterium]|nr:hypothetical protein [Planctomycetota bacterium]
MESEDRTKGRRRKGLGRRTCLYCFRPFRIERGSAECPVCGEMQSRAEQERYWTLQPKWRRIQSIARVGGIAVMWALAGIVGYHAGVDGTSLFWGLGLLAVASAFIWETGGLFTRRESGLPLGILWPAIVLCIALGPIGFSMMLRFIGGGEGQMSLGVACQWGAPWLGPFLVSLWAPKWLRTCKEASLKSGEAD